MTVKEAIIAGLYPTNEDGHWLVPMGNGNTAEIISINGREPAVIAGYVLNNLHSWFASGEFGFSRKSTYDLMPPKAEAENGTSLWIVENDGNSYALSTTDREKAERWSAHQTVYEIPNVKVFKP